MTEEELAQLRADARGLVVALMLRRHYRLNGYPQPAPPKARPSFTEEELRQRPRYRPKRTP